VSTECIRRPGSLFTLCMCPPCARRKRRLAKAARAGLLPERRTAAVWELVDARIAAGWSPLAVGSAAGLPERTIRSALDRRAHGAPGTWTHASEKALLASAPWPTDGMLGAHGPRRRLRALARVGYSLDALHQRSGLPMMTLSVIRSGRVATVRADTHRVVRELYDALSMTPGASETTRTTAWRAGWASPLAWDDDTIDDPAAEPNTGAPARHLDLDEWMFLVRSGEPAAAAARRCGVTVSAVDRAARRLGRSDVIAAVAGAVSAERRAG